jgi:hypothetical protein
MDIIFEYVSTGDLWGLAIIAVMTAILAANSNYQRRRALAQDRAAPRATQTAAQGKQTASGIAAHA